MSVDVAKLRELLAAATTAPWESDADDPVAQETYAEITGPGFDGEHDIADFVPASDAALIVALRNAAPGLLDEIESLIAREQELRAASETAIAAEIVEKIGPDVVAELERLRRLEAAVLRVADVAAEMKRCRHDDECGYGGPCKVHYGPMSSAMDAQAEAVAEARAARAKAGG